MKCSAGGGSDVHLLYFISSLKAKLNLSILAFH